MDNNPEAPISETARLHLEIQQLRAENAKKDQRIAELEKDNQALTEKNSHLELLSTKDELTGLDNVRGLNEKLQKESIRARRDGTPLCSAFIDLDGFKLVNDTLSHEGGNELLKLVSQTLNEHIRGTDSVARIGGDEFIILFPDTDIEESLMAITRLRTLVKNAIEEYKRLNKISFRLGFSTGIAELDENDSSAEAVKTKADKLMYRAKSVDKEQRTNENEALFLVAIKSNDSDVVLSSSAFDQIQKSHLPLPPRELNSDTLNNWLKQVITKPLSLHLSPDQDPMQETIHQYLEVAEFILKGPHGEAQCHKFLTQIRRDLKISNEDLLKNIESIQENPAI